MTLPIERTLSVLMTRQYLLERLVTCQISEAERQEIQVLLRHFPSSDDLQAASRNEGLFGSVFGWCEPDDPIHGMRLSEVLKWTEALRKGDPKTMRTFRARRAAANRAVCVLAANRALSALHDAGIDAVVFGSLVNPEAHFREDSDIDFCVMDGGGVDFFRILDSVRAVTGTIKVDVVAFDEVKPSVQQSILAMGVRYVE